MLYILTDDDIFLLGCGLAPDADAAFQVPMESAVHDCRAICSSMTKAVAVIKTDECVCVDMEATKTINRNSSTCNYGIDWGYFSASGLGIQDSDYSIVVTVEILGENPYVKPLESIVVHIATNFIVDVPFTVDFGDGTVIDVYGKEVSYYWLSEGRYDITVDAEVGIAMISGAIDFTVKDVDEGYAGDFVMLDTFHGDIDRLGNVDFTNIDYATGACHLQYGDRNVTDVEMLSLEEYVETTHVTHVYPHFGRYKLQVDCINPYGHLHNNTFFTSRKLETTYHFHDRNTSFITPVAGDAEFFHGVQIDHSDRNISVSLNESNLSYFEIEPEFLRIHENFLTYNFENVTVDKRIISVQNDILQPEIFSPLIDAAWNLTTNITIRVPPGNSMFLNVSFSAGEDQVFYIHYLKYQSDIVFEIMFPLLGYYPVQANLSNDISYSTADMLVSVEVPLRSISLTVTNITDKEAPVELFIDINEGMRGPMKMNFQIDQGNGYVDTYFHYNDKFFFPTYRHGYTYPDWGMYDICVRAFNRINSVIECITVQVGQKITYIDVTMPSAGRFRRNETTTSVIRCPRGSDKTYIVEFGDGETFVFTDRYLKETEHFDETTTTTTTTSTTAVPTTTEYSNTTMSSNNTSNGTVGNTTTVAGTPFNDTTTTVPTTIVESTVNPTHTESQETTAVPDYETSTQTFRKRRRREANGTSYDTTSTNDWTETSTSTQSAINTTESNSMVTEGGNITTSQPFTVNGTYTTSSTWNETYLSGNVSSDNTTDANGTLWTGNLTTVTERVTTTTTEPPTTTPMIIISTMEPIPDDATSPYTTNNSFARRRRDGTIDVSHRYQDTGTYLLTVKATNHFNWDGDVLCPLVVIADEKNDSCHQPELTVSSKYVSTKYNPMQYFMSEKINLTATVNIVGCGSSVATFSWRTYTLVMENGQQIRRPYHDTGICRLETREKMFQYPRSSLPFGSYVVTVVASPSDHPLMTSMHDFYMDVNPSPPNAVINGNDEHLWFLVYGTTMLKFPHSIDPDFHTHDGIQYDLVFMDESSLLDAKLETRSSMVNKSSLIWKGITHKYTSMNPVSVYEYTTCFLQSGNLTKDIRLPNGEFNVPSEYFVSDVNSFAMILYVSKNNLTTAAHVTFEIRLSNASNLLDQLDDLLKSKDTTGVMRAVEALSAALIVTPVRAL